MSDAMKNPEFRIVSLCPSNTELLFALGLGSYVVGVDNYSDYPSEALASLPRLGPDLHIDIDAVQALAPDLVVSSLSVPGMEKVVANIEGTGLRQLTLSSSSLAGVFEDMKRIEEAVPAALVQTGESSRLIQTLESRIERIRQWTTSLRALPRIYWEWWPNPVFSPARENWLTEMSEIAGGINIFGESDGHQVQDDGHRVCEAEPDVMLAVWTGVPQHKVPLPKILSRKQIWQNTPAFRNEQIYVLAEGLFCRPSPRLVDGLEQLVGLLHPECIDELGLRHPASYAPVRLTSGEWTVARS